MPVQGTSPSFITDDQHFRELREALAAEGHYGLGDTKSFFIENISRRSGKSGPAGCQRVERLYDDRLIPENRAGRRPEGQPAHHRGWRPENFIASDVPALLDYTSRSFTGRRRYRHVSAQKQVSGTVPPRQKAGNKIAGVWKTRKGGYEHFAQGNPRTA
jgi:hypothetical protein